MQASPKASYGWDGSLSQYTQSVWTNAMYLENRRRRYWYEQAGVEALQRLGRIRQRKTHPGCRKSDGLLARENLADDVFDGDFLNVNVTDGQLVQQGLANRNHAVPFDL